MRIYVGNMPFSTDERELRTLFQQYGEVESVTLITDRESGRSRGFGFVEMSDDRDANQAINALHEHAIDGRTLVVNQARPRSGGGGRGRW